VLEAGATKERRGPLAAHRVADRLGTASGEVIVGYVGPSPFSHHEKGSSRHTRHATPAIATAHARVAASYLSHSLPWTIARHTSETEPSAHANSPFLACFILGLLLRALLREQRTETIMAALVSRRNCGLILTLGLVRPP
jgi:hypothetical protein